MYIISHLFLLVLFVKYVFLFSQIINQPVFLNPKTNSAFIQCPLDFISSLDIQWYDITNQRYDLNRGRYYRIQGLQTFHQELICFSISTNRTIKFIIRIYNRPLPIQHVSIINITNTSLTFQWIDDQYNQHANITSYELILRYDHLIQLRRVVNRTISIYTFSSLYSSTFYSIEISVIDIWKRSSRSKTIISQTLPFNIPKKILFNKIIDSNLLDQSISCYNFYDQFLLIEFNQTKFKMLNHIYNLTIFNYYNKIIFSEILYSSFIYSLKQKYLKYKMQLTVSTIQTEYLGMITKDCKDFSSIYLSITCSIKLIHQNKYHLRIYKHNKQIQVLQPNIIFYRINQSYFRKIYINDIHHYINDEIIDIKQNYSLIIENDFLDEKLNISIICPISSKFHNIYTKQLSNRMIISLILLIIVLIILVLFIIYQKLYSFRKNSHRKLCDNNINDFDCISVSIDEFSSYVSNMHRDDDLGFSRLFENICQVSKNSMFSVDIAQIECNKSKNRYMDVLAYDHSRVKLSTDEYINANYVDGYEKINAYIATQGPMINTMNTFWQMIWEKDVSVIVMITNIEESGNSKCEIYWPEEGTEIYGDIEVTLINIDCFAYYNKRTFTIRYTNNQKFINNEHLVYQFHYTDWPDHGIPLYPLAVLSFMHRSSSCHSKIGGPMVVHCSAGIGRTGTYIVIDTMLKKLTDQQHSLNIPLFLKHIRKQRYNLVQTEEQFCFIYDVLLEAIELLNTKNYSIEKQFQLIEKQTNTKITNATYLQGYYRINQFIIIQHPTINTRIDFWKMIWNNQTDIIISLYGDENLSSDIYPLIDQIIDCENIHVYLIDEYFEYEYIYRNCLIRSIKDNYELRVKIISNSYWPETCSPIETSFNLINTIKNLNSHKPIVIHDYIDGYRAGTFCALYTMKEQLENEGILNVYELAKFYYVKRPGIWRNSDDLLFLYRCAEILFCEYKLKSL